MGVPLPVVLDIPPDIAAGLAEKLLGRNGSVVRDLARHIVKHPSEAGQPESADPGEDNLSRAEESGESGARTLSVAGVAVAGAGISGVVAQAMRSRGRVKALNRSLSAYLLAAKDGTLTVEHIDQLIADLDAARGSRRPTRF